MDASLNHKSQPAWAQSSSLPHDPQAPELLHLSFTGRGSDLFFLMVSNIFLTIITLGIYMPWARVRKRKFIMENTVLAGERFSFRGTGLEVLIGFIKAAVIFGLLTAAYQLALGNLPGMLAKGVTVVAFIVVMMFLQFIVVWGAYSYRLSRTFYRGVNFSMDPTRKKKFIKETMLFIIPYMATAGLALPFLLYRFTKNLTDGMRYGDLPYSYTAKQSNSVKLAYKNFFLTLITLGLYFPWASAARLRFDFQHTKVGENLRLHSAFTGGDIFVLFFVSGLVSLLSAGIAYPWAMTWFYKRAYEKVKLIGTVDFSVVTRQQAQETATGDGLAGMLDMELGF